VPTLRETTWYNRANKKTFAPNVPISLLKSYCTAAADVILEVSMWPVGLLKETNFDFKDTLRLLLVI